MRTSSVLQFILLALFSVVLGRLFRQLSSPPPPPSKLIIRQTQARPECVCPTPSKKLFEDAPTNPNRTEETFSNLEDDDDGPSSTPPAEETLEPFVMNLQEEPAEPSAPPICSLVPPTPHIVQHGAFYVSYNHVPARLRPSSCNSTITYTTHTGPRFLHNLIPLLPRWQGPVSVALFVPGTDFEEALTAIKYLRDCSTSAQLIRDHVSFHLFFPREHIPDDFSWFSSWAEYDSAASGLYQCTSFPADYLVANDESKSSYRETAELDYPINVARNIALKAALTDLVFPVDNELFPSQDLIPAFLRLAQRQPELFAPDRKNVFVVAVYELAGDVTLDEMPRTKADLQKLHAEEKAQYFHLKMCKVCHVFPKYQEWIQMTVEEGSESELDIFETIKRKNSIWEPFYIGRKTVPFWDERLVWRQRNKIAQTSVLCLQEYDFHVLDNAFLVHRPGIKKYGADPKQYEPPGSLDMVWNTIRPEMQLLFGGNSNCYARGKDKKV